MENNGEDFISTVSHELRTPLTSIRGFSQTMLASWDKLDDDSKKKFTFQKCLIFRLFNPFFPYKRHFFRYYYGE